jgi:2-phosphosulfolactate phosphatase
LPRLVEPDTLRGGTAVVIDVLRASTTIIHALAAGAGAVWPVAEVEAAKERAAELREQAHVVLLGGERGGEAIAGFDLGNSPAEYTPAVCKGKHVVMTTTNGTRALLHAAAADRVLLAAFVNFSAVCEQLLKDTRPVHLVCAGTDGGITLEDTMLAGAFVDVLHAKGSHCNDSARIAWDSFTHHGMIPAEAFKLSKGGQNLLALGYEDDLALAAQVDRFMIVPELHRDPLRLQVGAVGLVRSRWPL